MRICIFFLSLFNLCSIAIAQEKHNPSHLITPLQYSFVKDDSLKIIVWNSKHQAFHVAQGGAISFTISEITNKAITFILNKQTDSILPISALKHRSEKGEYTLYETEYPLIHITTNNTIKNDPKVVAQFRYYDLDTTFTETIGIEWRGNISLTFPKKTFDIEFREDTITSTSKDVSFLNLREDDDYVLDALYNEPLRLNAKVAQDLWIATHPLQYQTKEKKAKSGATGNFVELFLNHKYQGIYLLQDQVDRKSLQLKKQKNDSVRGLLYKAGYYAEGSNFEGAPAFNNALPRWAGFEMEYPFEDFTAHWEPLHNAIKIISDADDETFVAQIENHFNIENVIDYYLFVNLTRATDNLGKNYYLARYDDNKPLFFVPWDLDGTFGSVIDGRRMNIVNDILTNGLFERLWKLNPNKYRKKLSDRWQELRSGLYSDENLIKQIENQFKEFYINKLYERETLRWDSSFETSTLDYTLDWLQRRLRFLDSQFIN